MKINEKHQFRLLVQFNFLCRVISFPNKGKYDFLIEVSFSQHVFRKLVVCCPKNVETNALGVFSV